MEQAKYDQMQGMLNKLEDIKNSQESILDKINHVITDLFQDPDTQLEKAMEKAGPNTSYRNRIGRALASCTESR